MIHRKTTMKINDYKFDSNTSNLKKEQYVAFFSRAFPVWVKTGGITSMKNFDEANKSFIKAFNFHLGYLGYDLEIYKNKIEKTNKQPELVINMRNKLLHKDHKKNYDYLLNEMERYLIYNDKINNNDYKKFLYSFGNENKDIKNYLELLKKLNELEILNKYLKEYFKYIFQ